MKNVEKVKRAKMCSGMEVQETNNYLPHRFALGRSIMRKKTVLILPLTPKQLKSTHIHSVYYTLQFLPINTSKSV